MAVTHADLAPSRRSTDLGSKTGDFIIVLSILFGLSCFILCLMAEATRSQVTWVSTSDGGDGKTNECTYSGSGKVPLLCAAGAFLGLAIGMVVAHVYMVVAVSQSQPPALVTWDPDSPPAKSLTWQAGFFFVATWICFSVGEILLLVGLSVESGHLKDWSTPRPTCLSIRQGLFSAAGVFGLFTAFFCSGLYITALHVQRLLQNQESVQREVAEAAALYSSPPQSPPRRVIAVPNENPIVRESSQSGVTLAEYLAVFNKYSSLV
ncbi:Leucine-rich repeat-containing G-protein coupled receptor 4 like [Actinidia chinensis var. chinensis]|uniref:Leucine-rich repeat-containing G-protein coupled receptor 4 like n=1 Tax=Actinidia chinensis var. chinensis TaxID=1590841 RepID=A0A2R6PJI7_ACTCC|nr:Leucine-rich repeat-containing G-protein coupled receptor 4 like [Actinidia chinensis var. chinensis]